MLSGNFSNGGFWGLRGEMSKYYPLIKEKILSIASSFSYLLNKKLKRLTKLDLNIMDG